MSLIDDLSTVKNAMYLQILSGMGLLVVGILATIELLSAGTAEGPPFFIIPVFLICAGYKLEVARRKLSKDQVVKYAVPVLTIIGILKIIEVGLATEMGTEFRVYFITLAIEVLAIALLWHPPVKSELES
jgi:hypothetical protein